MAHQTHVTLNYQITFTYEREFETDRQAAEVAYTDLRDRLGSGGNGGYHITGIDTHRPIVKVYDDDGKLASVHEIRGRIHMESAQLATAQAIVDEERML